MSGWITPGVAARLGLELPRGSALNDLSGDQRRVIELAYFGGLSHSEIAEILELPTGTVKGRMRLASKELRRWVMRSVRADARHRVADPSVGCG